MSSIRLLTVGSNPNLVFYAWRLHETRSVDVNVVNPSIDLSKGINFVSESLGSQLFKPLNAFNNLSSLEERTKFDIIIMSCTSLQEFQTLCSSLSPFVTTETLFVVESTGYVNLEPFVQHSYPRAKNLHVGAIMNEFDIRQVDSNNFLHSVKNNDTRIFLGTSLKSTMLSKSSNFQKMYKLFQMVYEESNNNISLLKSLNPKEFMTYQWKLALPRIAFSPLTIIFETEFPEVLANQILCKPLMSGIVNEIFKIVKKMDCKLVKGYENENNLLKNWSRCYPKVTNNESYTGSPQLFFNFYEENDLELDLLLLQPILLGDDHGIRTPYLENLYSTMSQYVKMNDSKKSRSMFFTRKPRGVHVDRINDDYHTKLSQINLMNQNLSKMEADKQELDIYLQKRQMFKSNMENDVARMTNDLNSLNLNIEKSRQDYETHMTNLGKAQSEYEAVMSKSSQQKQLSTPKTQTHEQNAVGYAPNSFQMGGDQDPKIIRSSVQPGDDLHDLADIALYGDTLNGEIPGNFQNGNVDVYKSSGALAVPSQPPSQSRSMDPPFNSASDVHALNGNGVASNGYHQQLREKELELQRREQILQSKMMMHSTEQYQGYGGDNYRNVPEHYPQQKYNRSHHQSYVQNHPSQPGANVPTYGQAPNGYGGVPIEQQPPHGLPSAGLPLNGLPPNLRNQRISQTMNMQPRRQSSFPTSHQDAMTVQYGHPQPYKNSSFSNAAPIDPLVEQRFKANPKKNRRSAYPQFNGNMDGLDMGGRGGMPMPGAQMRASSRPKIPLQTTTASHHSSMTKDAGHVNGNSSQRFLQPPLVQGSNESSNSSSNSAATGDTPETIGGADNIDSNGVSLKVPVTETYQPLGKTTESNKDNWEHKKKKKGLFRK